MTGITMSVIDAPVGLGSWTILADSDDTVRATITRERNSYIVRNARGAVLGRFSTPQQALASIG